MSTPQDLPKTLQTSWHQFLETFDALRPDLYRYSRHLTRNPWDAEDLTQDTLARAYVTLSQMMGEAPQNPRAWLFRVASNLWIDRTRHDQRERAFSGDVETATQGSDRQATREATGTLLAQLSPQERAAVVLKDVLDLSLEEIADSLSTTVGAVKAALHRGRGRLQDPVREERAMPVPAVVSAFCDAFNAGDIDRLTALLLENGSVEVVGATTQYGQEAARKTVLSGMLFGAKMMANAEEFCGSEAHHFVGVVERAPRVEARFHRGSWVFLHWYAHEDGEAVRALTRIDVDGARVSHLRNYFYNSDLITEVCGELGLPSRTNGRCWWRIGCKT